MKIVREAGESWKETECVDLSLKLGIIQSVRELHANNTDNIDKLRNRFNRN